jgi:hypothetical protein
MDWGMTVESADQEKRDCSSPPPCQSARGALKHRRNLFGQGAGALCTILRTLCIKRIEGGRVYVDVDVSACVGCTSEDTAVYST